MSPFLAALRAKIGHDLLVLPSVSALFVDPEDRGRILLVRHAESGQWGTVGGLVEPEEHPAEAMVREAREETGLEVAVESLVTVVGGPGYTVTYTNGDRASYVTVVYEVQITGGDAVPDEDEVDRIEWFDPTDLGGVELGDHARSLFTDLGVLGTGERTP